MKKIAPVVDLACVLGGIAMLAIGFFGMFGIPQFHCFVYGLLLLNLAK